MKKSVASCIVIGVAVTLVVTILATIFMHPLLRLHWPAPSTGFVLQRADEPLLPTWITVTEPVVELNGENTVLVPLTAGMGGFRLVLP